MEWIHVSDRFPEDKQIIIGYDGIEVLPCEFTSIKVLYEPFIINEFTIQYNHCCQKETMKVTHWMPLPPCPINKKD